MRKQGLLGATAAALGFVRVKALEAFWQHNSLPQQLIAPQSACHSLYW
jgi:hypothetical protein